MLEIHTLLHSTQPKQTNNKDRNKTTTTIFLLRPKFNLLNFALEVLPSLFDELVLSLADAW